MEVKFKMRCPICNGEMEEGGIITDDISPMWVPMDQFNRKGLKRLIYSRGKPIGEPNIIIGQTKISNAFFCEGCNKIIGVFPVTNKAFSNE